MATTVTSKGQVTIPKPIRDHLGIGPGSRIAFRRADDGNIVIEKADGTEPLVKKLQKGVDDLGKLIKALEAKPAAMVHHQS